MRGKSVMIVDDGLATGSTMLAAIRSVRTSGARHVAVATPVASAEATSAIHRSADEFHCPMVSAQFGAVGEFYDRFETITDDEVKKIMASSLKR
ncbi:MAG: phosphoribosyltransferase family protein [Bacteroidota bacterium]